MQPASFSSQHSASAPTFGAQNLSRSARSHVPTLRRRQPAPPAAVDPATAAALFATAQVQEFGLTLLGVGMVAGVASSAAAAIRGAAGAYTGMAAYTAAAARAAGVAAPAPTSARPAARATAADVLVEQSLTAAAATNLESSFQQPSTVGLGDLRAQLHAATEEAVAAVKSAAESVAKGAAAVAPAAPPAQRVPVEPNGVAVRPGLTVEEATKQVKEWIEAWRGSGEAPQEASAEEAAPAEAPTTRVTEPSMPPSAAAVLSAMTADAPVANTDVEAAPASALQGEQRESVLAVAGAVVPAGAPDAQGGAAEMEAAYKARITAAKADSKLAQQRADRRKAVEVAPGYEAKISQLWASSKQKHTQEREALARSEAILRQLAAAEAEERGKQEEAAAAVAAAHERQLAVVAAQESRLAAKQDGLRQVWAQLMSALQAALNWVQQLVARLTGGGAGRGAGASA